MIKSLKKIIVKHNALPASLTYFVTNRCNLSCRHCFYWNNLNREKNELSLAEIDKFSKSLGSLMVLNLSGGEPFLRKDFADIVKVLARNLKPPKLIITSNGSLTEKIIGDANEILKNLKKTHITFHFSIDDIKAEHDASRGMPGLFEKVTGTIGEIKKLKEHYGNFNVGVLLTVNPVNQKRVLDVYKYIRDYIKPDVISPVLMRLVSRELDSRDVDIRYYEELIIEIKKDIDLNNIKGHHNFPLAKIARNIHHLKHRYIIETAKRGRLVIPCFAGVLSGVIYEDGNVAPCEIMDYSFGNIRDFDYDFRKLWLSRKARDIKNRIKEAKCFCTYECAMDVNVAFNPKTVLMAGMNCLAWREAG